MPILLKIRLDGDYQHYSSMRDGGHKVGKVFKWGSVGKGANYKAPGDINFVAQGEMKIGDLVILRERQSATKTYIVGVMKVVRIKVKYEPFGDNSFTPYYELLERFDGSATLEELKASNPRLAALPHFRKNAKGMMLRSFTSLTQSEFELIVDAARASMPRSRRTPARTSTANSMKSSIPAASARRRATPSSSRGRKDYNTSIAQPADAGVPDDVHPAEQQFLLETLRRLRARDPWTRGHFAEVLVTRALPGAVRSNHSAAPFDIKWRDGNRTVTITVRTTGSYSMDHHSGDNKAPFSGSWRFPFGKRAWDPTEQQFVQGADGDELRRCWADVAVLCRHDSLDITDGWTFAVVPRVMIEQWSTESITPTSIKKAGCMPVDGAGLAEAIRKVVASPKRANRLQAGATSDGRGTLL